MPSQAVIETEIADRRVRVADKYLRGLSQPAIAMEEGVHQSTISRDLDAIREEWRQRANASFEQHVAQELVKIDRLELEHWRAWERSVGKHVVKRETLADGGDAIETVETSEDLAGDPRFLQGIAWCIERRCRLMGLDAPKRIDAAGMKEVMKVLAGVDMERL